jgi:outer membrane protein assembly factor BamB
MNAIKRRLVLHAVCLLPLPCYAEIDVLTYNYDNARTGQNVHERVLSPTSVPNLQKLFSFKVGGESVLAQPLFMHDLEIPEWGTHDVLFVATEGDKVFAFDADNSLLPYGSPILWEADLLSTKHGAAAGESTVPSGDLNCSDYGQHVGITGTPVIDRATHTLYVVSKSKSSGSWINRLHALDILKRGAERRGSPVKINLDPALRHNNHAALLLEHGRVYVAFASHCDTTNYHGTVIAFDARTLHETHRFVTTSKPSGQAGIWMAGSGPAADAHGHIYIATGNGNDANNPGQFDNSIIKLDKNLGVADYFTACDTGPRNSIDRDLGLGGVALLPEQPAPVPHLLVQAGKVGSGDETKPNGTIYVLDRDRMTTPGQHRVACNTTPPVVQENPNIWQDIPKSVGNVNAPAYWNQSVYIRGADGPINRYKVSGSKLLLPSEKSSEPDNVNFGASIIVSAEEASNGVVWAENYDPATNDAVLRAYDALTLKLLYSSDANPTRDTPGGGVPFGTPMVADGKVYVGVVGEVAVYGIPKASCSYGPDQCKVGYVWRDAYNSPIQGHDHVCVTEAERTEVQSDNLLADKRRSLNGGPYGRNTCLDGFLWREANPLDRVCVARETRSETARQNREAFDKVDPMCRMR